MRGKREGMAVVKLQGTIPLAPRAVFLDGATRATLNAEDKGTEKWEEHTYFSA